MSNYMRNRKTLSSVADAYREMYATPNEDILNEELIDSLIEDVHEEEIEDIAEYLDEDENLDESKGLAAKAKKSGISVGTLRKVYNRGMAAWKTGHRPGTTPQQWGMARVNAFIVKKKKGNLNHDKDLAHVIHPDDNMLEALTTMPDSVKDRISNLRNKKMDVKYDSDEYHRIQKQIDSLMRQYSPKKESMDEALKPHEKIISKTFKTTNKIEIKGIDRLIDMSSIGVVQAMQKQNPRGFTKTVMNLGKLKEDFESLDEVKRQEVDAMKKVSKEMQKVLVSYQKIANMGDKELKDTKHNKEYKKVLDARDTILKMIGTLNTKMLMQKEELDNDDKPVVKKIVTMLKKASKKHAKQAGDLEKAVSERFYPDYFYLRNLDKARASAAEKAAKQLGVKYKKKPSTFYGEPIKGKVDLQLFGNKKLILKVLDKTPKHPDVVDLLKQFESLEEGKGKNFAQQAAIAIAKKKSGKYDKDGKKIDERVKDGKLDPLSKMGKSKLTGQEINKYYRDNPKQKAAARDKTVKKAIELALDLSGATNYAIKEIEKLKRGLSKNPAVKLALRHANESKEFTGHHVVIENLSPANVVKLKTFGKMMAKMTKLPFDEKDPEKSIDKLMGQIWKQKHVPANWERLHKMVAMLRDIGVKMPSLKGKYMGLDPVTKKAIFYKEGTEEIVEWHQKIEDIKEGIEELVEKKEMSAADIKKIEKMTDRNDHTGSLMHLAKLLGDKKGLDALKGIMMTHKALGHMPDGLMRTRNQIYDNLMRQSSSKYSNHKDVISSF